MEQLGAGRIIPGALCRSIGLAARHELDRITLFYRRAQVPRLAMMGKLRREILLGPNLLSVLRINAKRLSGIARPGTGLPPGMA